MLERRRARHQALHILYQREITDQPLSRILSEGTFNVEDGEPTEYCRDVVLGVEMHQARIDRLIEETSENWALSRMPLVDRNILRLAVYEMNELKTPAPVVIDEALELARQFSGDESVSFINGVLDAVHKQRPPDATK